MYSDTRAPAVFRALMEPTRWLIVTEMMRADELDHARLETLIPLSNGTIAHHLNVLLNAGLLKVRKRGRHHFYILRRDVLAEVLAELADLVGPRV